MATLVEVGGLGSLFAGNNLKRVEVTDRELVLYAGDGTTAEPPSRAPLDSYSAGQVYRFALDDLGHDIAIDPSFIWSSVSVSHQGRKVVLRGLTTANARAVRAAIIKQRARIDRAHRITASCTTLESVAEEYARVFKGEEVIADTAATALQQALIEILGPDDFVYGIVPKPVLDIWQRLDQNRRHFEADVSAHNDRVIRKRNLALLREEDLFISAVGTGLEDINNAPHFVRSIHLSEIERAAASKAHLWDLALPEDALGANLDAYLSLRSFVRSPETWRQRRNERFVTEEVQRHHNLFAKIGKSGLTEEQMVAAVTDESRQSIVASAGSGKTTTLFAKALYLVETRKARAKRILAITYTEKATKELRERLSKHLAVKDVAVKTIHALGLDVLASVSGHRSSPPPWDEQQFANLVDAFVGDAFQDPSLVEHIVTLLALNEHEVVPAYEFTSVSQYFDYCRHVTPISLKGEMLKSVEECLVANFLFLNGIEYKYEEPYEFKTANRRYRQYKPDFFLPKYGIYIEHYGVARNGSTALNVDAEKYAASMEWKRALHSDNDTVCLETFSYLVKEYSLARSLRAQLKQHNVEFNPIESGKILEQLRATKAITRFHRLIRDFIPVFKERDPRVGDLRQAYAKDVFSSKHLVPVLRFMLGRYNSALRHGGWMDFSDMITEATRAAKKAMLCDYDVVLLDEAQDMSHARASFIRTLIAKGHDMRFTAVGDDWQSIFRFSGSDVALFRDFEAFWGTGKTLALTKTFRFDDGLAKPASTFIRRNTAQTQRDVLARERKPEASSMIVASFVDQDGPQALGAVEALATRYDVGDSSLLFIYRTFEDEPYDLHAVREAFPRARIDDPVTAHKAKGLEADFVVILGADVSWCGFPTRRPPNYVVEPLLPKLEPFEDAEERRLFYVAITRARRCSVVCVRATLESPFSDELRSFDPSIPVIKIPSKDPETKVACRSCRSGYYLIRPGRSDTPFAGCSNFPGCRETFSLCPTCKGILGLTDDGRDYLCSSCGFLAGKCPTCERGLLRERSGRYGLFLACTGYDELLGYCEYTKSLRDDSESIVDSVRQRPFTSQVSKNDPIPLADTLPEGLRGTRWRSDGGNTIIEFDLRTAWLRKQTSETDHSWMMWNVFIDARGIAIGPSRSRAEWLLSHFDDELRITIGSQTSVYHLDSKR